MTSTLRKLYASLVATSSVVATVGVDHYAYPSTPFGYISAIATGLVLGSAGGHLAVKIWTVTP